jgi:hypothetical protein
MSKYDSRKYILTKAMLAAASAAFILPPLITYWFMPAPLILLTGTEWISFCGSTLLVYFGGNVLDKKVAPETNGEK